MLKEGGQAGKPLSARTVGHAHRLLRKVLARAVVGGKVFGNVASNAPPPKVPDTDPPSLEMDEVRELLEKIEGHRLYYPVLLAIGSGVRRGELLALRWKDIDLDESFVRVERSLGEAGDKLYFKVPKSKAGRRTVSISPVVVDAMRRHRKEVLELRVNLGLGKLPNDALVFSTVEGKPISPDKLSRDWANLVRSKRLPRIPFHGLRHTNVSMLIDGGLDVYQVARRIGHKNASLTLDTYTHLFRSKETEAAAAIEAALTN